MEFEWTSNQAELQERVVAFAEANLNEDLEQRDRDLVFDPELWRKCAEFGILGCNIPEEFGGGGRNIMRAACLMEALGR